MRGVRLHLLGLHLHLTGLHLHLRDLQLRRMELALGRQQFPGKLLAIAFGALLHRAEVLAKMLQLLGHGADLVLQLHARSRVAAFDTGGEELRQRQRHDLDFAFLRKKWRSSNAGNASGRPRVRGPAGIGAR